MQPPMVGNWNIQLHAVRPFTIHGDVYYEVHAIRTDDPLQQMFALRIPQHLVMQPPATGESWRLTFLMGQVTGAVKIT